MNKRHVFLLTAVLGMAAAQGTSTAPAITGITSAPATVAAADPQLSQASVTIEMGNYSGPLSSLLAAVSKAAGYGLILDVNVDLLQGGVGAVDTGAAATGTAAAAAPGTTGRPLVYSFQNKPFNQVWPLLMDVYGLSYEVVQVGGQPVLRVGNAPIQRIVKLQNADAVQLTNQVKLFFGTPTYNEVAQRDAQGNTVGVTRSLVDVKLDSPTLRIVPDLRSNSVVVRGTNREVGEVSRLLAQLDVAPSAPNTSSANTNVQTVQRVYTVRGQQADISSLLAAQYPNLRVTPVGQTGQLVLTGPQNQIDAALGLLGQVDRETVVAVSAQTVQRVFQLVNASAEEVKATLEGTLARDLTPVTQPLANVPVNATDASGNAVTVTVPTSPTTAGQAAQTQAAAAAGAAATAAQTGNGATIIADRRTNSIIVRGSSAQVAQIADLIPQLDQVVPQINVQVRIQEVSDQALRTLGLDWKVGFGGFNVSVGSGGLGAAFDPTRSLVGFNIFPTLTALENQSLTKRVYDGSITMQSGQRSLTSAGGAQNASSNAAANIKSGGRIEINIPSSAGNIVRQIDYGVNLDFFDPQVSPDGTITLRVRGQVNQPDNIPTTGVPNILNFTNSEAQSTITFKNGQTILMSGLMGTNETRTNSGVPFLSTLPVVGAAFGKQTTNRTQTQLMVIITGNVVR
ncbi:secretin N-terminal domain-containing protein [Deinococcus sp. Leaf326]|uniref:secretin N-terminal domain-containing protein n=1 Tax=Deinococcus sp. Leaf326 TaxID=1736338 RepID=UPI0006FD1B5D|nr:secretin N-terminal domain-containing protein [Deinococcus sp. Leaf326]KQR27818.1 secretin [Deinococcus sp. Leaf326]